MAGGDLLLVNLPSSDRREQALEDIALARAIEEGEQSELVTRDEVFKSLSVKVSSEIYTPSRTRACYGAPENASTAWSKLTNLLTL
jgi:hypothetical protein